MMMRTDKNKNKTAVIFFAKGENVIEIRRDNKKIERVVFVRVTKARMEKRVNFVCLLKRSGGSFLVNAFQVDLQHGQGQFLITKYGKNSLVTFELYMCDDV